MAIKVQGSTIIDDSRVLINTGNVGVGTTNPDTAVDSGNTGIVHAGIVTANKFYGDGSNLTGISAGQVGALAGFTVREEGSTVGTVGSVGDINFVSSNLTATASGAIGATITLTETPEFDNLSVSGVSTFNSDVTITSTGNLILDASGPQSVIFKDGGSDGLEFSYFTNGDSLNLQRSSDSSKVLLANRDSANIELYHNNSKKLETTNIGIAISNGTTDTATITGPSNLVIDPAVVGDNTGSVRIKGDLFVDGTTTQINSTTLEIADFVVGIASTATTDLLTDGAGIQIGPDNTFLYEHNGGTNPSLKSSENLNVAAGKGYQVNQVDVLNATTLGSGVTNSSLTSVGTLSSLNVSGVSTFKDNIVISDGSPSTNQKLALNHNIQSNNLVTIRQNAGSNFGDDADVTSINALLNYQGTTSFTSNRTHTGLDLSFNHTNSSGHSSANGQRLSTRGVIIDLDHNEGANNTQSLIVQNQILKRYTDGSNTQIGINNDVTFNNSSGDASGSTGTHTIFGMDTDISFTGVNDNNVTLYGLDTRVNIAGAGINTFTSIYGSKVSLSTPSSGTSNNLGISYAYYADYDYDAAGSYDQAYLYYGNYNNSSKATNG